MNTFNLRGNMQFVNHTSKLPQLNALLDHSVKNIAPGLWLSMIALVIAVVVASAPSSAKSPEDEISWLNSLASSGDVGAQLEIGLAYRDGRYGATPDSVKGFYWLSRAAENGNAYAEDAIANMYAAGTGTEKNRALAIQWWKKAIEDGNHEAKVHLAEAMIKTGDVQQAESLLK
jgi:TPR repeat protein